MVVVVVMVVVMVLVVMVVGLKRNSEKWCTGWRSMRIKTD